MMLEKFGSILQRIRSTRSGRILLRSFNRFSEERGGEVAASLAYYTLFSLFPFFLALIAAGSFFLEREQIFRQVQDMFLNLFPGSKDIIQTNLKTVLDLRGAVGIIGLVSLFWSASGMFSSLIYNVNRAWPDTRIRNFLRKRLAGLAIVILLGALVIVSVLATTTLSVLTNIDFQALGGALLNSLPLKSAFTHLLSLLVKVLAFLALYLWAPNRKVALRYAVLGAVVAGVGWELATAGFTWYLTSGIVRYELVYGSLGAIVVLMFWVYISSLIIIYGAHLAAACEYVCRPAEEESTDMIVV
ncbi:MAG: YihY/virulence factor BrkB family protein [Anaerolineales bacterium]